MASHPRPALPAESEGLQPERAERTDCVPRSALLLLVVVAAAAAAAVIAPRARLLLGGLPWRRRLWPVLSDPKTVTLRGGGQDEAGWEGADGLEPHPYPLQDLTSVPPKFALTTCNPKRERKKLKMTHCPDNDAWLTRFAESATPPATIVFVGCNKGIDAVRMLAQYDTRPAPFELKDWQSAIKSELGRRFADACHQTLKAKELSKPTQQQRLPDVYCIEPLPVNVKLLKKVAALTNIPRQFHILPYAIGVSTYPSHVPFEDSGNPGSETGGVSAEMTAHTVLVNASTVDALFGNFPSVDMLFIDAEGHDPLALLGSATVLGRVSYLEFENHGIGEWATYKLKNVIDYLDNLGLDCWWMTNRGKLVQITRCWHESYGDLKKWSNIGCARRFDSRWKVMNSIWLEQA